MTKIESAMYILKHNGRCGGIACSTCPLYNHTEACRAIYDSKITKAKEYVMDHQEDLTPDMIGELL